MRFNKFYYLKLFGYILFADIEINNKNVYTLWNKNRCI